eukprot:scaffold184283_cov21-Tisochrysis_lutea.AAC.1
MYSLLTHERSCVLQESLGGRGRILPRSQGTFIMRCTLISLACSRSCPTGEHLWSWPRTHARPGLAQRRRQPRQPCAGGGILYRVRIGRRSFCVGSAAVIAFVRGRVTWRRRKLHIFFAP